MAQRTDGRDERGRFPKGTSGNRSGVRKDAAPARSDAPRGESNPAALRARFDEWQNFFTGQGMFGRDKRIGGHFQLQPMSFDQLRDLWLGDDLAARAVETIPKEAMRQGYDLSIATGQAEDVQDLGFDDPSELSSEVLNKLELLGTDEYIETAGNYERGYGGGAILLGANDGQADLTRPLNLNNIKSFDWMTPLEARELMPLYAYSDPRAPKYGQPEIYQLSSRAVLPSYSGQYASSTMMIHESRLVVFPGIRVSRYQTTTARGGWGESVLSRVFRVLRDFNNAWTSAGVLVTDFAQSVIKIAGLWEALTLDGAGAFQKRLEAMEAGRSSVNAITIDAGDSYERQQTPLSGLPDLLQQFAVRLAASCDMPLTLLFGTSPAGMNATGESDIRLFYDRVAAYQKRKIEPALRRICQIIFRTIGNRQEPDKWTIKFRPLWQESAKDKAAAMLTQAQADSAWITANVLSAEEVAAAHWGKGEYDPNITVDFAAREAEEPAAAQPYDFTPQPGDDDYIPPPGTEVPPDEVPPPGDPTAPDPNTPPKNIVRGEDSADLERRDEERDEHGRFAGGSSPAQAAAQSTHEAQASDHARQAEFHASKARALNKAAEVHAAAGDWGKFQKASQAALGHQQKATTALAKVSYHAERAGTASARANVERASSAIRRRDAWSDEAREAAIEARRAHMVGRQSNASAAADAATAKAVTPRDHVIAARLHREASIRATQSGATDVAGSHYVAAKIHQAAANANKGPEPAPGHGGWHTSGGPNESQTFGHEDPEHAHGAIHPEYSEGRRVASGAKPNSWAAEAHGQKLGSFPSKKEAKFAVETAHAQRSAVTTPEHTATESASSPYHTGPAMKVPPVGTEHTFQGSNHPSLAPGDKVTIEDRRVHRQREFTEPQRGGGTKTYKQYSGLAQYPHNAQLISVRGANGTSTLVSPHEIGLHPDPNKRDEWDEDDDEDLELHLDAWSEEARAAALEARRANAKGAHLIEVKHGMKDPKGREVGGHASITHDPKRGWVVNVTAERNGAQHGASHNHRNVSYSTPEEAHEAAIKGLQAQGDRYREKFGHGETTLVSKGNAPTAPREHSASAGKASEHSAEAQKASGHAFMTGKPEDHQAAAAAHKIAAKSFEKAGPEHKGMAEYHATQASAHKEAGKDPKVEAAKLQSKAASKEADKATAEAGKHERTLGLNPDHTVRMSDPTKAEHEKGKALHEKAATAHGVAKVAAEHAGNKAKAGEHANSERRHGKEAEKHGEGLKKLGEFVKGASTVVGGEAAGKVAAELAPGGEGGGE